MNNQSVDPIESMSDQEINDACGEILRCPAVFQPALVGLIIEKLQEWDFHIEWKSRDQNWKFFNGLVKDCFFEDKSIQVAFLKAAIAMGKWTPPQKVKEEPVVYFRHVKTGCLVQGSETPGWGSEWQKVRVEPWDVK